MRFAASVSALMLALALGASAAPITERGCEIRGGDLDILSGGLLSGNAVGTSISFIRVTRLIGDRLARH